MWFPLKWFDKLTMSGSKPIDPQDTVSLSNYADA